jgi:hypothetical protein
MMVRLINIIEFETQSERRQGEKRLVQLIESIDAQNDEGFDQYIDLAILDVDKNSVLRDYFARKNINYLSMSITCSILVKRIRLTVLQQHYLRGR